MHLYQSRCSNNNMARWWYTANIQTCCIFEPDVVSIPWHHSAAWPCLKIPGETNSTSLQTGSNWPAIERKCRFNPWKNRAAARRAWRERRREDIDTPHTREEEEDRMSSSCCLWSLKHTPLTHKKDRCALVCCPHMQKLCISQRWQPVCGCACEPHTVSQKKEFTVRNCRNVQVIEAYCDGKKKKAVSVWAGGALDQHVTRAAVVASFKSGGTWQHCPRRAGSGKYSVSLAGTKCSTGVYAALGFQVYTHAHIHITFVWGLS